MLVPASMGGACVGDERGFTWAGLTRLANQGMQNQNHGAVGAYNSQGHNEDYRKRKYRSTDQTTQCKTFLCQNDAASESLVHAIFGLRDLGRRDGSGLWRFLNLPALTLAAIGK